MDTHYPSHGHSYAKVKGVNDSLVRFFLAALLLILSLHPTLIGCYHY